MEKPLFPHPLFSHLPPSQPLKGASRPPGRAPRDLTRSMPTRLAGILEN